MPRSFHPEHPSRQISALFAQYAAVRIAYLRLNVFFNDVTNTGNGERGTGVWEQVYSGKPLENSKWRSKQKKRLEEKQFGLR